MRTVDDLRAALDYPSGPATADIAAIIRRGQRRRAVRLAGGTGLATVAAIVAVVVATSAFPNAAEPDIAGSDPSQDGSSGESIGGAQAAPPGGVPNPLLVAAPGPPTEAPEQFDPLMRTLHVGWIPEGLANGTLSIEPRLQTYSAFNQLSGADGSTFGLELSVLARGRPVEDLPLGAAGIPMSGAVETPTDPIDGQPAVCLSDAGSPGTCRVIRWLYAPDAWGRVAYRGTSADTAVEVTAIVRRIAESVSLTAGEPLRLPFGLDGSLATMRVAQTIVAIYNAGTPGQEWSAVAQLTGGSAEPAAAEPGNSTVLVTANHAANDLGADKQESPNTTVDGHPARLERDGNSGRIVVWGANRTRMTVELINRPDDPLAMYRQLRLPAGYDDPANWLPVR